jgi:hypothetical protein
MARRRNDNNVGFIESNMDKKALRSTFGSPDDVFDIKLPWSGTEAPDVSDMFNGTLAVRFVYAGDSEMSGHLWPFLKCE